MQQPPNPSDRSDPSDPSDPSGPSDEDPAADGILGLGATPVLPAPNDAAFKRIQQLFQRWMVRRAAEQAQQSVDAPHIESTPRESVPRESVPRESTPRDYPLARAFVAAICESLGITPATAIAGDDSARAPTPAPRAFPPHGAPTVRAGAPTPRRTGAAFDATTRATSAAATEAQLSQAADSALLVAEPDGTASFDIVFKDALLGGHLACRIAIDPRAGVVATFRVADAAMRRRVADHADELRQRLTDRGLAVAAVRVEVGEPEPYHDDVRAFLASSKTGGGGGSGST